MTTPYPPPSYTPPDPAPTARNGFGVTALVTGIVGIMLAWIPIIGFLGFVLGAIAIVFGGLAVYRAHKDQVSSKGLAYSGLILGIISFIVSIVVFASFANYMNQQTYSTPATGPGQQRVEPGGGGQAPIESGGSGQVPAEADRGEPAVPPVVPQPTETRAAPAPDTQTVAVKATGDLGTADVTYTVGDNTASTQESLPFTVTEEVPTDGFTIPASILVQSPLPEDITASMPEGTIGCQILVDGMVADENTANTTGGYASVTCNQPGGY